MKVIFTTLITFFHQIFFFCLISLVHLTLMKLMSSPNFIFLNMYRNFEFTNKLSRVKKPN